MTGIAFGESPRWAPDGRLWFADWGTRQIIAVDVNEPANSEVIVQRPPASFQPISFDFLPDGRLIFIASSEQRLVRREADGSLVTHADLSHLLGSASNIGFNEIVIDGMGRVYVNGGSFDAPGIVTLVTPDGASRQVADGMAFPNGMAITPDNATLIIAESYGKRLTACDIANDGSLSHRRVWADLSDGVPDGICVDADGAVWYADVPNKRCSRVREGGDVLQRIDLDLGAFACMLGGADRRTLFMLIREWRGFASATDDTRTGQLLSITAPTSGAGWP